MNRFFTLFVILIALIRWLNIANAQNRIPEPVLPSRAIRAAFDLDPFYQQWIDVEGFPVLASAKVNPYAVKEAAWLLRKMIGHRRDLLRALVLNKVRFVVIGYTEMTTDIPEYSDRRPAFYWDRRQRGSGGSRNSAVSCTEENLLDYPGDTAPNGFQLIHEFAHAIHHMGLDIVDTSFDHRLRILYEAAMTKGLWNGTYAASNRSEYWAEGTHAWIDPKGGSSFKRIHGGNTRAALKVYDPDIATLLTEIYGDSEWRYTPVATRTHLPHLQGFDPQDTPTFRWPEDVEEPYAQLRDPDIDSGDEWVNLNPYNPSQLLHLNPPILTETRTHVLLVNLADFDVLVYQVYPNGTERLLRRIHAQRGLRHAEIFNSRVGDVYLVKDPQGRSLALFQAEEQTGRALIGDGRPRNTETDNSPVVEIPDPNLERELRRALRIPSSARLTQQAMRQLTTLNVYRREVKNLIGLEYATGLTELKLSENQIQDVTPLRGLTQLRELHLHVNRIQDITPIDTLTELRELRLRDNQIRDVSALAGLTKLRELWLSGNPIEDTAPLRTLLKRNPNLKLDIDIPQISGLIPDENLAAVVREGLGIGENERITKQGLRNLTELRGREKNIRDLTGLEYATQLRGLSLANNRISDLSPLAGLKKLKGVSLFRNRIRDLSPLEGLTQLNRLDLRNNQISNIRPIKGLTRLTELSLDTNKIKDITPLAGLKNLEVLKLEGNPIQDFSPLASLTKLSDVDVEIPQTTVATAVVQVNTTLHPPMYWIDAETGTLYRLIGSKVENFIPEIKNATSIAVDTANNFIYWTEQVGRGRGNIKRANLDGSNVQRLATLNSVPRSIAIDTMRSKLYWTNSSGHIQRANLNGKQIRKLIKNLDSPENIIVDVARGKLYWTESAGVIRRANLNGKSMKNIASDLEKISGIAISGNKIYWTEITGESRGKIGRANLNGSNLRTLATLRGAPSSIAFDSVGKKLYWTDSGGNIHRVNLNGKQVKKVVSGLITPSDLRLDSSDVATVAAAPSHSCQTALPDLTHLFANYPNPFNPETWIPYQLAKPADVTLTIYAVNGEIVRQLVLGHQPVGIYQDKNRAAYWDGKNALGEPVASGVYFYTLTTGDFTATRKMLIRK